MGDQPTCSCREDKTPMWLRPQADPCRVMFTWSSIPPWRRVELDFDPEGVVWDPNDRDEDAYLLNWLDANAPGWTTEVEIVRDGGYAEAPCEDFVCTHFHAFLRFAEAGQAAAYRDWREGLKRAWDERHALVREGESCCWGCGGPVVVKRQTREVQVRGVLIRHSFEGLWCEHCGSPDHIPVPCADNMMGSQALRILDFNKVAREVMGIPKGRYRSEEPVATVIETDETFTDEQFRTLIAAFAPAVGGTEDGAETR